jgi:hypothetical protein
MFAEFSKEKRQVEQVCYFDGVISDECAVITTITFPDAKLEPGRFRVEPQAMSEAGKHLRALKLCRIAQVHTHPTEWVGHSPWDNEWAYSQLPGAVSIVLPHFGRTRSDLYQVGVHLRSTRGWEQLSSEQVKQNLRIVPTTFDFRKNHEPMHIKPPRKRSWWSVLAFWRR